MTSLTRIFSQTDKLSALAAQRFYSSGATSESLTKEFVTMEKVGEKKNVGLITLNHPKALNVLCEGLMKDLSDAVNEFEKDPQIGTLVLTGNGKTFAAGGDIKEMQRLEFHKVFRGSFLSHWMRVSECTKPVIAAVNGYALGGGCELAMMCDIIYASEAAKFAQPEILIGTIPGAGATQKLIRTIGKSKAMEICLTGAHFSAAEAERMGLVSKVVPPDQLMPKTLKLAEKISSLSKMNVQMCKEAINKCNYVAQELSAYELTLKEGLHFERRLFHATFATEDRVEGMTAFVEKRPPKFQDK